MIEFRVDGQPVPQGSMKVINGRVLHSQGSALAVWRSTIAWEAKCAGAQVLTTPVEMTLLFVMNRGKTVKRDYPTVPPDLDKLVRAVLDALTGIAYEDDSQVIGIQAYKIYGQTPGVQVKIASK